MANPTAGFGLRAVRRLDGAALAFQMNAVEIAYNNSHVIAQGDLVKPLNTGFIDLYAAAGGYSYGVFMGCSYRDPNLGYTVWRPIWNAVSGLASTDHVTALIIQDPQIVYEIRCDDTTAAAIANIGETAELIMGSPSALTGQSVAILDYSTFGTTTTYPVRMVGLGQGVGNDNTLANNIVEVVLNTMLTASAATVTI